MSKRLKFFLGHLTLSSLIALIVIGIVFFVWYPFPLAQAVSVTHLFLMMLAIDVIIGPILGLLVYKDSKNLKNGFEYYYYLAVMCFRLWYIQY